MNAEIIAVGSELLLGQIANTNAQFISKQCSEIGMNVFYHTVVGDNANRLKEAIEIAEARADCIIFSGGLGPTKDDLTKETISKHLNTPLVINEDALQSIEQFFEKVGRPMTENNRKQALVLDGCKVLTNHFGMAPGMFFEKHDKTYILLPGPPKELNPMFQHEAKPILTQKMNGQSFIVSHVLRFYGIGEAELETRVQHLLEEQINPTIAPLASDGEVTLRITAKSSSEEEAKALIEKSKQQILELVGEYMYGVDDETLPYKLVQVLNNNGLTIAAAESLTAGLFCSELAEIPGVSSVLQGGVVTYSAEAKIQQLDISSSLIETYGVVSSECASAMAIGVQKKFNTAIGIGLTGVAGPGPQDGLPAGTVWIGIAIKDQLFSHKLQLHGSRNTNRLRTVKNACSKLIRKLNEQGYK